MSKRKKSSCYHDADGNLRPLAPIEQTILQAFAQNESDSRFHDAATIAGYLNGGRCFPTSNRNACERVASVVLRDLRAMGYVVADSAGWLRLAPVSPLASDGHDAPLDPPWTG